MHHEALTGHHTPTPARVLRGVRHRLISILPGKLPAIGFPSQAPRAWPDVRQEIARCAFRQVFDFETRVAIRMPPRETSGVNLRFCLAHVVGLRWV